MSLLQQVKSGVLWSAVANVGGQAVFAVVFFVLARLLEPAQFGLVAYAAVFSALFGVFLRLGYSDAIIQVRELDPEHLHAVFWLSGILGVVLAGLTTLAAGPIAVAVDEPRLVEVLCALSFSSVLAGFNVVPSGLMQRELRFRAIANRTLLANTVAGVAGVAAAFAGGGVWALVVQRLLVEALVMVLNWRAVDYRPMRRFSMPHLREMTRFGNRVFGINLVNYADQFADQFLIGIYIDKTQLGIYSVGKRLSGLLSITLLDTFRGVTFPMFSRVQGNPRLIRRAVCEGTELICFLGFPVYLLLAVFAAEVVHVAFGAKWYGVVELLWAFSLMGLYSTSMIMFIGVCKGTGHAGYVLIQRLFSVSLNVLVFIFAARFGVFWVAVTFAARAVVTSPFQLYLMKRAAGVGYREFGHSLLRPAAVAVVTGAVGFGLRSAVEPCMRSPIMVLLVCIPPALLTHAVAVRVVAPELWPRIVSVLRRRSLSRPNAA